MTLSLSLTIIHAKLIVLLLRYYMHGIDWRYPLPLLESQDPSRLYWHNRLAGTLHVRVFLLMASVQLPARHFVHRGGILDGVRQPVRRDGSGWRRLPTQRLRSILALDNFLFMPDL